MLRKKLMLLCGIAMLSVGTACGAYAEENAAEAVTEAESGESAESGEETDTIKIGNAVLEEASEAETEEDAALKAEVVESIVLQPEGGEPVTVANTAKLDITGVSVTLEEEDQNLADVTLVDRDGKQYEFKKVEYADMQEPELVVEGAFAFLKYTGIASGKERSVGQTGELEYEEAAELFAVDDVYIRSEPDSEAEILGVIKRGDAIEVQGETATHYKVTKEDVTGYTVRRCISEDEQEAIAAVQAEAAARAQIQAAAEAAAAAAAQQQAAAAQQQAASSVHEVSRQKFDDCDGSGHGYYLITYSDGSTKTQDY